MKTLALVVLVCGVAGAGDYEQMDQANQLRRIASASEMQNAVSGASASAAACKVSDVLQGDNGCKIIKRGAIKAIDGFMKETIDGDFIVCPQKFGPGQLSD